MLKLDQHYYIETNANNWTLRFEGDSYEKKVKGKITTVTPKNVWYYPNLKLCLNRYMNEVTKPCSSVENILLKLEEIEAKIEKIC